MNRYVNLLPKQQRITTLLRGALVFWSVTWIVTLALVSGVYSRQLVHRDRAVNLLQTQQQQYLPIANRVREMQSLRSQLRQLEQRENVALRLAGEAPFVKLLGICSVAVQQCDGQIGIRELVLEEPPQAARERTAIHKQLTLKGLGVDNLSVARFVANLRDMNVFTHVELNSTERSRGAEGMGFGFELQCVY